MWVDSVWNWCIIPHKYQVKPHSSLWFSATSAASIVHRSHFFRLYQQYNLFESKSKFRQASNYCKRVLEAAKLAYGNKITCLLGLLANCYCVLSKGDDDEDDDDDDDDELLCRMVDRGKAISLISSRDHCQRSSPSRISDTPRAVVITTTLS